MQLRIFKYLFTYIFLNVFLMMIAFMFEKKINIVEWISFIQLLLSVAVVSKVSGEFLSVYSVFIILTYLFHFGQALIRIFPFQDVLYERGVIAKTSIQILVQAELFAMLCIFAISTGYLLVNRNRRQSEYSSKESFDEYEMQRLKSISLVIFVITLLPMLYIDLKKIFALSSGDYEATYSVYQIGIGKYIGLIAQFGKPALSLLIFAYHDKKKVSTFIMVLSIMYLLLVMLSGDRGTSLIYIVTIFLIYFIFVRKPKLRTVLLGIVIGYFLLGFLSALSLFRYADFSVASFFEVYARRKGDGIIYSVLREFGGTMLSLTHAMQYIPQYTSFGYGVTYLAGVLYISPVLPEGITDFFYSIVSYIRAFPASSADYVSLGGSYLGELYYNFGWCAPIFSIFIGIILKKIDIILRIKSKPRLVAVIIVLLPSLVLWVRDFYVNMIFKTFWLAILILYVKWGRNGTSVNNYNG